MADKESGEPVVAKELASADEAAAGIPSAPAARNSLFILVARLIELGASVAIAAVVARLLGVGVYGRYALIVAFVMLFGQFISFGLEHIIIRELARSPARIRDFLGTGMTLEGLLGAAVVPAAVGISLLAGFEPSERWGILIFGVAFAFRAFYEVIFRSTFVALGVAQYETALALTFQTLRLTLVLAAALMGWGVNGVLSAVLVAEVINAVISYGVLRWRFAPVRPRLEKSTAFYLLRQAWPIAAVGVLNNIYLQQDTLLLKWLTGDYLQVGYFAAAYRLVTFFIFVSVPMLWPLLPAFSKLAEGGAGSLVASARQATRVTLFFVAPSAILAAAFAPFAVAFVFGSAYAPAAAALSLLAFTMVARPVGYIADATLIANRRQWLLAIVAGAAVAVNFVADIILIPRMGFVGAAWGTMAADFTALVVSWTLASAVTGRFLADGRVVAPLALAAAIGAALWATRELPPYITGPAAVVLFAVGTLILLTGREKRDLMGVIFR